MAELPFYAGGLKFSCVQCSACCRFEPGFVFISKKDADILAIELKMQYDDFVDTFCRWIPAGGEEQLSLREKVGFDCIFWENGCSVYNARPLQCRTFPFWFSNLASEDAWKEAAAYCPGMNQGRINSRDYIETCLIDRRRDPVISRAVSGLVEIRR